MLFRSARRDFSLSSGEALHISLRQRPCRLEDLLDSRPLPCISAGTPDGERAPDLFRQDGRPALAIWLEEGGEPSEHVLNELLLHRAALDALPVRLIFLLRSRESLEHPALAGRLSGWNRYSSSWTTGPMIWSFSPAILPAIRTARPWRWPATERAGRFTASADTARALWSC